MRVTMGRNATVARTSAGNGYVLGREHPGLRMPEDDRYETRETVYHVDL